MSLPSIETKFRSARKASGQVFIKEVVLSAVSNTIILNNIPQIYRHLQIKCSLKSAATGSPNVSFTLNNDSSTNYAYQELRANNATVSASSTVSTTNGYIGIIPSTSNGAVYARGTIDFFYYRDIQLKTWQLDYGYSFPTGGQNIIQKFSGSYNSTAPITSIKLIHDFGANNFAIGSKVTLYGIY